MTSSAYELLALVFACKALNCPELSPRPYNLRTDPKFSDALDFLIDSGYVTVSWMSPNFRHPERRIVNSAFNPGLEIIGITDEGVVALGDGVSSRYPPVF